MDKEKFCEYRKRWYQENKDHCREYANQWSKDNPGKIKEYGRRKNSKLERKKYMKEYYSVKFRKDEKRRKAKMANQELKRKVINAYGGFCLCCGEAEIRFLTLDHINGDGKQHRERVKSNVYFDLIKRGFPQEGYQILCMNCNWAIRYGTPCPHKLKVLELVA